MFCSQVGTHADSWALLDASAVQSDMEHQQYSTTQRYLHHRPRPADAAACLEALGGTNETVSPTQPV